MTFIDICREISPNLQANANNTYQDYTKKLKDIFASLGIIKWLDSLKIKGEYDFSVESKDFIKFLLKEYSESLANLRNESKQNEIQDKDIIYIYSNIDKLFKGRVSDAELVNIKIIVSEKFNIPERYPKYLIDNCEKQAKKTIDIINRTLIPEEARILLGKYYTKELCAMITKICRKWEDIAYICDDDNTVEIIEAAQEETRKLSNSFSSYYDIYTSIKAEYFCPEDPNFPLNEKLKKIHGLDLIQNKICYLISKRSKTGNKKADNIQLEKLRKQKKELIQQQVEKDLQETGLDFSEVIRFKNELPNYKKTPSELVHEAIDFYLNEQSILGKK